jgi:hypothetical protein
LISVNTAEFCLATVGGSSAQAQWVGNDSPIAPTNKNAQVVSSSGNVYAAGGSARPTGPVNGDFMAVGGSVVVDQTVKEDATLAADRSACALASATTCEQLAAM